MANNTLLTVFAGIIAAAFLVLACVAIGVAAALRKAGKEAADKVSEIYGYAMPLMATMKDLLDDCAPKMKKIGANVEHISGVARREADHVSVVMDDVLRRSQKHVAHVDVIIDETLDQVDQTRHAVGHMVNQPVKWAMSVTNGVKAGVETLLSRRRSGGDGARY